MAQRALNGYIIDVSIRRVDSEGGGAIPYLPTGRYDRLVPRRWSEASRSGFEAMVKLATGSEILLESLHRQNVEVIFGLPGGAVLPLYDALYSAGVRHLLV